MLENFFTLAELKKTLTLDEIFSLVKANTLQNWLWTRALEGEANILSAENVESLDDDELLLLICWTLEIDVNALNHLDATRVEVAAKNCRVKEKYLRECGEDGEIVTNQREFIAALKTSAPKKFYLCGGVFNIPLRRECTTYDGRDGAVIDVHLQSDGVLDFDACQIYFYNLTLVFHYLKPEQVKLDASRNNNNNFVFLNRDKVSLNDMVKAEEISDLLLGRKSFEPPENFQERAESFQGVVVGHVLLDAAHYAIRNSAFFIQPSWDVDFISQARKFAGGSQLCFYVAVSDAEKLFTTERAFLLYADFYSASGDDAEIFRLYIQDKVGTRYYIGKISPGTSQKFTSGGTAGYGLELILADLEGRKEQ